jgi:hypothetical protein
MLLLNRFLPYSDSWDFAVNSYIKHSMHCIGVHDVAMHDVACMTWLAWRGHARHNRALRRHVLPEHARHGRAWR